MPASLFGTVAAIVVMGLSFALIYRFMVNMLADGKRQIESERIAHREQLTAERAAHREQLDTERAERRAVVDQLTKELVSEREHIEILQGENAELGKSLSYADATLKSAGFREWIESQRQEKLDKTEAEEKHRRGGGNGRK